MTEARRARTDDELLAAVADHDRGALQELARRSRLGALAAVEARRTLRSPWVWAVPSARWPCWVWAVTSA